MKHKSAKLAAALWLTALGLVSVGVLVRTTRTAHAAVMFTVTSQGDESDSDLGDNMCDIGDGECTLRAALEQANVTPGADAIHFAIDGPADFDNEGGAGYTIKPTSALPTIQHRMTIDGYSQPGSMANPFNPPDMRLTILLVQLDGSLAGNVAQGLGIEASRVTIQGLAIINWQNAGIKTTSTNTRVIGNFIGVDFAGAAAANGSGVVASDASNLQLGSAANADFNIISGNTGDGVVLNNVSGSSLQNNLIGVDYATSGDVGNGGAGIRLTGDTHDVLIGGEGDPTSFNYVSFNDDGGVVADGEPSLVHGVSIIGNRVHSNNGLGIDLITSGANDLLNYPTNITYRQGANGIALFYQLDVPAGNYRIEFFSNGQPDSDPRPEGYGYLGHQDIVSDGTGIQQFSYVMGGSGIGHITATATVIDPNLAYGFGSTSEFSEEGTVSPNLRITNTSLVDGLAGTSYTAQINTAEVFGAVSFSVSGGSLPPGITLNEETGEIVGTPTTAGTYMFTIRAMDEEGSQDSAQFGITITKVAGDLPSPSVNTSTLLPRVGAEAGRYIVILASALSALTTLGLFVKMRTRKTRG